MTPLQFAVQYAEPDTISSLLNYMKSKHLDVKVKDKGDFQGTAIHWVPTRGLPQNSKDISDFKKIINLLVASGIDINSKDDKQGATILHYCAFTGFPVDLLKHLVGLSPDLVNIKNKFGELPSDVAGQRGHQKAKKYLDQALTGYLQNKQNLEASVQGKLTRPKSQQTDSSYHRERSPSLPTPISAPSQPLGTTSPIRPPLSEAQTSEQEFRRRYARLPGSVAPIHSQESRQVPGKEIIFAYPTPQDFIRAIWRSRLGPLMNALSHRNRLENRFTAMDEHSRTLDLRAKFKNLAQGLLRSENKKTLKDEREKLTANKARILRRTKSTDTLPVFSPYRQTHEFRYDRNKPDDTTPIQKSLLP